jgi:hypothetical protein
MSGLDLFENGLTSEEAQEKTAVEFLEGRGYRIFKTAEEIKAEAINCGYRVLDPLVVDEKIRNVSSLRNHFYRRLWGKFPNERSRYIKGNDGIEYRMFELFIKSRMDGGLNRENAIQECVLLINTIFDHFEEFNFKNPVDVRVIGTGKAGWIVQKAASILMRDIQQKKEKDLDEFFEEKYSKSIDDDAVDKELDALLKRGKQDGEEKGRSERTQKWE